MREQRHSYGIIPFFRDDKDLSVLLILQSRLGPKVWGFPKGTPEKNELPVETAVREVCEEIGCKNIDVQETNTATESYTFTELDGSEVDKKATYFLGFLPSKEIIIQDNEVDGFEWLTVEETKERITYPETRKVFEEILERFDAIN